MSCWVSRICCLPWKTFSFVSGTVRFIVEFFVCGFLLWLSYDSSWVSEPLGIVQLSSESLWPQSVSLLGPLLDTPTQWRRLFTLAGVPSDISEPHKSSLNCLSLNFSIFFPLVVFLLSLFGEFNPMWTAQPKIGIHMQISVALYLHNFLHNLWYHTLQVPVTSVSLSANLLFLNSVRPGFLPPGPKSRNGLQAENHGDAGGSFTLLSFSQGSQVYYFLFSTLWNSWIYFMHLFIC